MFLRRTLRSLIKLGGAIARMCGGANANPHPSPMVLRSTPSLLPPAAVGNSTDASSGNNKPTNNTKKAAHLRQQWAYALRLVRYCESCRMIPRPGSNTHFHLILIKLYREVLCRPEVFRMVTGGADSKSPRPQSSLLHHLALRQQ